MPSVKQGIQEGRALIGSFVSLPCPSLVELIGHAGLDFCILDTEHGPPGLVASLEELVRACGSSDTAALVRVMANRPEYIAHALDVGAEGVVVPQVNSSEDAYRAVAAAKYPPEGRRGLSGITRAAAYGARGGLGYTERSNQHTVVIVQIETPQAIDNLDDLLAVPLIDGFFLGAADLASAMGFPMQPGHAEVQAQVERVIERVVGAGRCLGAIAPTTAALEAYHRKGVRLLATATNLISRAYGEFVQAGRAAIAGS